MLAKPVHDRGSMRGLFHRASLLCFYRTSGLSIHKYNSSIAPIDSWHAVNTHPPCPGVPIFRLTTALSYWCRLSNCLPLPTLSQLPWPVDRAPNHPTTRCVRILGGSLRPSGENPDDYISPGLSAATPPTRERSGKISTVLLSIISSPYGKCTAEDKAVVIELQSVAGLNPSTRIPQIRNIHGRRVQIHPAGKFLIYPRFITNHSISVRYAMSLTPDFSCLPFLSINSSRRYD